MACKHDDCFTCPYPDCIASEKQLLGKKDNSEYLNKWYMDHREEILAKRKAAYASKKKAKI